MSEHVDDRVPDEVTDDSLPVESEELKKKRSLWWLIGGVILIILLVVGGLLFKNSLDNKPVEPLPVGAIITVPDNTDYGMSNEEEQERILSEQADQASDDSAPSYSNPTLDEYREVKSDGTVVINSPIDGQCPVTARGTIGAPDNYMHSCWFEQNGAVYYTSHAVIGPRTGALENIKHLEVGQIVTLDGEDYEVTELKTFNAISLPPYMFKPGMIGLITCHIDDSVKSFEDFSKTDVVMLEKKN